MGQSQIRSLARELQKAARPVESIDMAWFPVRCCCQPDVLFGFIRLSGRKFANGQKLTVADRRGRFHEVEIKQLVVISDEVDSYVRQQEMAVYSDDRAIGFWRTIPGFRETTGR